jgi:hypothetical protein
MAHVRNAQALFPRSHLLTYLNRPKINRQWYLRGGGLGGCKLSNKPAGHSCDEYPFFKTFEGGPNSLYVSLKWVPAIENSTVGGHFGYLASKLKKSNDKRFVVIPSASLPTIATPK